MKMNWKLIVGMLALVGLLIAQQPVQLQTYNGGGNVLLGHGTAAGALRVELPTDGTGVVGLNAGSNVIGHVIVDSGAITATFAPTSSSSGAFTKVHASSSAAANIKASAGNLYGLAASNNGTAPCYLQLFNNAGTPTAGTAVIDSYYVQAGVTVVIPPGIFAMENFATGIAAAGATTDSGATTTGCTTTFSYTAFIQ